MKNAIDYALKERFRGFYLKGREYKIQNGEFHCISGGYNGLMLNDFAATYEVEYQLDGDGTWRNLGKNFCSRRRAHDALIKLMQEKGTEVHRVRYVEEINII